MDSELGYSNFESAFADDVIRKGFIRKVYSILMVQLSITFGIVAMFLYIEPVQHYMATSGDWLIYTCMAMTFVVMIVLACCEDVRRQFPTNMILLMVFTVCEGLLLGSICSTYDSWEVLMAAGICIVVTLAITLFAFQTKIDFTVMTGLMLVAVVVLLIFGIFAIIFNDRIVNLVYASLGALIFAGYLVIDTQLMIGGKHKYSLSPEEYVFAALNLYLDIINLFLYLLMIIKNAQN
ncbi:PREDICTED: protein lifeguard 1-like [Priapulus caudatus]|uniref:Protein lifeguard 1-like n=2 Tax=Priapulus caudatus TaxID=37621 RepID=A0ABM1EJM5_PRICU|nr:PREDICTED: protein lifeguard 1-like [Priapulus caudatus]